MTYFARNQPNGSSTSRGNLPATTQGTPEMQRALDVAASSLSGLEEVCCDNIDILLVQRPCSIDEPETL